MVGHAVMHHLETPLSETSYTYLSGETAGAQLAPVIERVAVVNLASEAMERMTKPAVNHINALPRKPVGGEKRAVIVTETPITVAGNKTVC